MLLSGLFRTLKEKTYLSVTFTNSGNSSLCFPLQTSVLPDHYKHATVLLSLKITQILKGQFTPKLNIDIFPLTCSVIYQSRLLWCELPSFGAVDISAFSLI